MSTPKMYTHSLCVFHGHRQMLHSIDMNIECGHILALIGPTNSGKSSFLHALCRLPDETVDERIFGRVFLDEQDISRLDVNQLHRRVAMLSPEPTMLGRTVFKNVIYGPRMAGVERAKWPAIATHALKATGLWDVLGGDLNCNVHTLSPLHQQMLCLSRALANEPEVLLLDEINRTLDTQSSMAMETLICSLRGEYTIVMATRNLQQAARISDETALLMNGQLIETGATRDIFYRPRDKRTEDFITGREAIDN